MIRKPSSLTRTSQISEKARRAQSEFMHHFACKTPSSALYEGRSLHRLIWLVDLRLIVHPSALSTCCLRLTTLRLPSTQKRVHNNSIRATHESLSLFTSYVDLCYPIPKSLTTTKNVCLPQQHRTSARSKKPAQICDGAEITPRELPDCESSFLPVEIS